jgi:hypothetical protein
LRPAPSRLPPQFDFSFSITLFLYLTGQVTAPVVTTSFF